jgi:hypothetical protein
LEFWEFSFLGAKPTKSEVLSGVFCSFLAFASTGRRVDWDQEWLVGGPLGRVWDLAMIWVGWRRGCQHTTERQQYFFSSSSGLTTTIILTIAVP